MLQKFENEEEQVKILNKLVEDWKNSFIDVPEDIAKCVNENFWEIYHPLEERTVNVNSSESRD